MTPSPDLKTPITVLAKNHGNNRIELTADQARRIKLYLHPKMLDFNEELTVVVNGKTVFVGDVQVDPTLMLELAREFDDRDRVFWATLEFDVTSDREVEFPDP
jgi:hypothetical protein